MNTNKPATAAHIALERFKLRRFEEISTGVQEHKDSVPGQIRWIDDGSIFRGVAVYVTRSGRELLEGVNSGGYRLVPVAGGLAEYQHAKGWHWRSGHYGLFVFDS